MPEMKRLASGSQSCRRAAGATPTARATAYRRRPGHRERDPSGHTASERHSISVTARRPAVTAEFMACGASQAAARRDGRRLRLRFRLAIYMLVTNMLFTNIWRLP